MHSEALEAIIEDSVNYRSTWQNCFARQLKAEVITDDDITFLATYDAAASASLEYLAESGQAPTMTVGEPWDSNATHFVVQDDPEFRAAEADRAYNALAEIYKIMPIEAYRRHNAILQSATTWHNEHIEAIREQKGLPPLKK